MSNHNNRVIFVIIALILLVQSLPSFALAKSEAGDGEGARQMPQGEGMIDQIDSEGVIIDDMYFALTEDTKYVDSGNGFTVRSHMKAGMYVHYIISFEEKVNHLRVIKKDVEEQQQPKISPTMKKKADDETLLLKDGVWTN